jgi:anti-sigma factor RsiW
MNCNLAQPLLEAYADGELDLMRGLELEQHLLTCPKCAAEVQSVKSLSRALRSAQLSHAAPQWLQRQLWQTPCRPEETGRTRRSIPAWVAWAGRWLAPAAALAAVLVLALHPGPGSEREHWDYELVADHVRSLMLVPNHLTDVVSSDQHTVKPWFNGKLDFAPEVKDFSAQGFPLIGGRLDYLGGRTVGALVYRCHQHYINVFVWPKDGAPSPGSESYHGYNLVNVNIGGLHYSLVSDLNANELGRLADLLRQ